MLKELERFVGEWGLAARFEGIPASEEDGDGGARVVFEWMPGELFLIERWEVPIPEAPDGIAVIGPIPMTAQGSCSTTSTPAVSPASTR